jgi:hypothetical protein
VHCLPIGIPHAKALEERLKNCRMHIDLCTSLQFQKTPSCLHGQFSHTTLRVANVPNFPYDFAAFCQKGIFQMRNS